MAIQRSDLPQLNENMRALQALLLGGQNQRDLATQKGQQDQQLLTQRGSQEANQLAQQGEQQQALQASAQAGQSDLMSQRGQQEQEQLAAKHRMGQEALDTNISRAQQLAGENPNAGVTIAEGGNVGISRPAPDPYIKQQMHLADQDTNAAKMAFNTYNKGADKRTQQIQKFDNILSNLNSPGALQGGLAKTEIIGALGMNRFNQQEAASIYGPSFQNLYAKAVNAMGGSEGTLSPGQINSTRQAIAEMYQAAKDAENSSRQGALSQYRGSSPASNPQTLQRLQDNLGSGFDQQASNFEKKHAPTFASLNQPSSVPTGTAQTAVQPQGIMDKLKAFLTGGAQQQAPQDIAAPTGMSADQKAARIQELLNKKNGQ